MFWQWEHITKSITSDASTNRKGLVRIHSSLLKGPFSNSGFKTRPAKSRPNLTKRGISKPDQAILAGAGFETGVAEQARSHSCRVAGELSLRVCTFATGHFAHARTYLTHQDIIDEAILECDVPWIQPKVQFDGDAPGSILIYPYCAAQYRRLVKV